MLREVVSHVAIQFAGQELWLDASGALFWPAQNLLVAADLHFEKASFLAHAGGHPLPPYDTQATLRRLGAVIKHYAPERLVLLGDSFHDMAALGRMAESDRAELASVIAGVRDCLWIEGNHDEMSFSGLGWRNLPSEVIGGFNFLHQPDASILAPQLVGHFHPKTAVRRFGHKIGGRCFVVAPTLIVLPAFGAYAGGLDIESPAFLEVLGQQSHRAYLCHRDTVYPLPPR